MISSSLAINAGKPHWFGSKKPHSSCTARLPLSFFFDRTGVLLLAGAGVFLAAGAALPLLGEGDALLPTGATALLVAGRAALLADSEGAGRSAGRRRFAWVCVR